MTRKLHKNAILAIVVINLSTNVDVHSLLALTLIYFVEAWKQRLWRPILMLFLMIQQSKLLIKDQTLSCHKVARNIFYLGWGWFSFRNVHHVYNSYALWCSNLQIVVALPSLLTYTVNYCTLIEFNFLDNQLIKPLLISLLWSFSV